MIELIINYTLDGRPTEEIKGFWGGLAVAKYIEQLKTAGAIDIKVDSLFMFDKE